MFKNCKFKRFPLSLFSYEAPYSLEPHIISKPYPIVQQIIQRILHLELLFLLLVSYFHALTVSWHSSSLYRAH